MLKLKQENDNILKKKDDMSAELVVLPCSTPTRKKNY
jgi:hypothetical protein